MASGPAGGLAFVYVETPPPIPGSGFRSPNRSTARRVVSSPSERKAMQSPSKFGPFSRWVQGQLGMEI